jgi:predicted transposase YbfD/YdcC
VQPARSNSEDGKNTDKSALFAPTGIDTERWPGVKTLLCIERKRSVKGKCSTQRSYYISSVATTAAAWMKMIRGHWCIENRLHWPKDVVLDEDASYGRLVESQ